MDESQNGLYGREKKEREIITVDKGPYFPIIVVTLGVMLMIGALSVFLIWAYQTYVSDSPYLEMSVVMIDFALFEFPIIVGLSAVGAFLVLSKRKFQFDVGSKMTRETGCFGHWEWGNWIPFEPKGKYLAFQRYEQNYDYKFGGIYDKQIQEYVYDLRLVQDQNTFTSIVSGSDFRCVAQIISLGKKIGEIYGLTFNDYVKEIIKKEMSRERNYDLRYQ